MDNLPATKLQPEAMKVVESYLFHNRDVDAVA